MTDKRREWNNDMMDPDWTPSPQSAFKEFMGRKKIEYMNTHPGMFNTVHVTDWAEEYLRPLESRLSASIRLREILDQDLEAYKTLVHRQAELLERCHEFICCIRSEVSITTKDFEFSLEILKDLAALGEE